MLWQRWGASSVAACWIALSSPAHCNGLPALPENQMQTAKCMAGVVSTIREVTEPHLIISYAPKRRVFITYNYHHRDKRIHPEISHEKIEITKLISPDSKPKTVQLGGITSPGGDLNDADSGMLRIADLWKSKCGLKLVVYTD